MAAKTRIAPENLPTIKQDGPDIHQMVRAIKHEPDPSGQNRWFSIDQVDEQLRNWIEQGFRLHTASVEAIAPGMSARGQLVEGGKKSWEIFYILVKD